MSKLNKSPLKSDRINTNRQNYQPYIIAKRPRTKSAKQNSILIF